MAERPQRSFDPCHVWFRGFAGPFIEIRASKPLLSSADLTQMIKMLSMVRDWTIEDERAVLTEDFDPC